MMMRANLLGATAIRGRHVIRRVVGGAAPALTGDASVPSVYTLEASSGPAEQDFAAAFSGDDLTYAVSGDGVTIDGSVVTLTPAVTLPTAVGTIADKTLTQGDGVETTDLSTYFSGATTYSLPVNPDATNITISGTNLLLDRDALAEMEGETIVVKGVDANGFFAVQQFTLTVEAVVVAANTVVSMDTTDGLQTTDVPEIGGYTTPVIIGALYKPDSFTTGVIASIYDPSNSANLFQVRPSRAEFRTSGNTQIATTTASVTSGAWALFTALVQHSGAANATARHYIDGVETGNATEAESSSLLDFTSFSVSWDGISGWNARGRHADILVMQGTDLSHFHTWMTELGAGVYKDPADYPGFDDPAVDLTLLAHFPFKKVDGSGSVSVATDADTLGGTFTVRSGGTAGTWVAEAPPY